MAYYDSFMSSTQTPHKEYYDFESAFFDDSFDNASTYWEDIEEETSFGTLEFSNIKARITDLVDSKVGDRNNEDYKKILFQDIRHSPPLGTRYRFDNNIWIVYVTSNIRSIHSACYLRRCNQTINTQDKYGFIHQEPCIIDLKPTKSSLLDYEDIFVPFARQTIEFQLNDWTKNIAVNTRMMFGNQVYRVGSMVAFNRTETFDQQNGVKFVRAYIEEDLVNEFDNAELQIADYKQFDYSISVPDIVGVPGTTGTVAATVSLNGEVVDPSSDIFPVITWTSSNENIASATPKGGNTAEYALNNIGSATLTASCYLNTDLQFSVDSSITVADPAVDVYETRITPDLDYLALNQGQEYSVVEYKNGAVSETAFTFSVSGAPKTCYTFHSTDNSFTVYNKKQYSNGLLTISCKNERSGETIEKYIELGGLF